MATSVKEFPGAALPRGEGRNDEQLLRALRAGEPGAPAAFFARYHGYVERLITRVLGFDNEIPDLVQEVFVAAWKGIEGFRGDHGALSSWLGQITIRTARGFIRKRKALRWLSFGPNEALEDMRVAMFSPEERQVLRSTYQVLERLPVKERVVFVLRAIEGMDVNEVAAICDISVATVKRRSKAAQQRFLRLAMRDPVLREFCQGLPLREGWG